MGATGEVGEVGNVGEVGETGEKKAAADSGPRNETGGAALARSLMEPSTKRERMCISFCCESGSSGVGGGGGGGCRCRRLDISP